MQHEFTPQANLILVRIVSISEGGGVCAGGSAARTHPAPQVIEMLLWFFG